MSIERGTLSSGCKVGEDWREVLRWTFGGVAADWTGCEAKITFRYGDGPDAEEAFTLSTGDGTITFGSGGLMTLTAGRALTSTVRATTKAVQLTGDVLLIDAASASKYYLDVILQVAPRSTVR